MKNHLIANGRALWAAVCLAVAGVTGGHAVAESSFVDGTGSFVARDSAVDSAGFTWIAGSRTVDGVQKGYLMRIDQAGGSVEFPLSGSTTNPNETFLPVSIAIGTDLPASVTGLVGPVDAIYLASPNRVIVVDPAGKTKAARTLSDTAVQIRGIAYSAISTNGTVTGAVYYAGVLNGQAIVGALNADLSAEMSGVKMVFGNNDPDNSANAIAVDETGDVYVGGRLSPGTSQLSEVGLGGTWNVRLYQKPGNTISNFSVVDSIKAENRTPVATAQPATISYDDSFPGGRRDDFFMIAEGLFHVPQAATYYFRITSDDGQRLFIDDQQVINDDSLHGATSRTGQVYLEAGFHRARYEMFERGGNEFARLEYGTSQDSYTLMTTFQPGGNTGYVFKFDPSLQTLKGHYMVNYGNGGGGAITDLVYSRGWVYATGSWIGTADAGGGTAIGSDALVLKLDSALILKGRARVTGAGDQSGHSITTDEVGNVYFTGSYGPASADFIGQGGSTFASRSSSVESRYFAKLNSNMEFAWVETEKNQAPQFNPGAIDTTAVWNESIQKLFVTGVFTGNGTLTYGNPGQLRNITGGQGFLAVLEPDGSFTRRVDLTVISQYGKSGTQVLPFGGTPDLPVTRPRIKGAQITVSVPEAIYQNVSGQELANPSQETIQSQAERRLRPTGYTLSDGTITDDGQFVYSGKLNEDLTITFNWVTEYALTISLDLSGTTGTEIGRLASNASGRPDPEVRKHWVGQYEQVAPEIDGMIPDLEPAGGYLRYVVLGYKASGPPNTDTAPGDYSTPSFFPIPTVEQRHKVPAFTMEGPAKIEWVLLKQNGIQVSTTGPASMGMPYIRVLENPSQRLNLGLPEQSHAVGSGTFYFDEHTKLMIGTLEAQGSQQLRGWLNGDGIVFPSNGGISDLSPFLFEGRQYRGIRVDDLTRPARVMWDFGDRIYEETVSIGNFVTFSRMDAPARARLRTDVKPDRIDIVTGPVGSATEDMVYWDPQGRKLYPLRPGEVLTYWRTNDPDPNVRIILRLTLKYPAEPHYRHIARTPGVNLDPDPNDLIVFRAVKYTECEASAAENLFQAPKAGYTVLLFGELNEISREEQQETARVRVVRTKEWSTDLPPPRKVPIGRKITSAFDTAGLDTGYVFNPLARFNPFVYNREQMTGPIIPVNLEFETSQDYEMTVVWYERRDNLLWPYQAEMFDPYWPTSPSDGLGRIVIASEFGSECVDENGNDQVVIGPLTVPERDDAGNVTGTRTVPAATTYDPSRFQQLQIYNQPDRSLPGYNPNEEHALIAPSKRFAHLNPLPEAAFALRDNDLNITAQGPAHTSHPYVLTQFLDTADGEYKMRVYRVIREDSRSNLGAKNYTYTFDTPKVMEAGKPVIPFYPLGHVIGATPCRETFGLDEDPSQLTYWEDHKGGSWAVSGGDKAKFRVYYNYPLQPDFWWPPSGIAGTNPAIGPKQTGDSIPFLANHKATGKTTFDKHKPTPIEVDNNRLPQAIRYRAEWPVNVPVLKVGETLTFAGGEYKTDNPTTLVPDGQGGVLEQETPSLPGVLAWAAGEVVYDHLNPDMDYQDAFDVWTARLYQALEERSIPLSRDDLPATFQPANTDIIRVSDGKWFFAALPASLQKRVFYDPVLSKLTIRGLLNDRDIGDPALTSAPPPLYVLEPNLMTPAEVSELLDLAPNHTAWRNAVTALDKYTCNPALLDKNNDGRANAFGQDAYIPGLGKADDAFRVGLEAAIVRDSEGEPVVDTDANGIQSVRRNNTKAAQAQALGAGLALTANPAFLDPNSTLPDVSYVTIAENNHSSLGGSPVSLFVIKVDRSQRYRGAIKTILSDNVFDENIVIRHQGDFLTNSGDLVFEWWYRVEDGRTFPPPDRLPPGTPNPWKLFTNPTPLHPDNPGRGFDQLTLKGSPNAPEILLSDTLFYVRYRHRNEPASWNGVTYEWAGAANSSPKDNDLDGEPDYRPQLVQGWVKRVLDAVNPYEARIRDFTGDSPAAWSSMLRQLGPPYAGPVALNPSKNVVENVGLIELYHTILDRALDLTVRNGIPVTPGIGNAIELASTRLLDFYSLLGGEAYADAQDPTIGFDGGSIGPSVFAFQNQVADLAEEELALLRGIDSDRGRPFANRLFPNFTKGEGEPAYVVNYNLKDANNDGFIDESDALLLYPHGHGDAWGHYLTAVKTQYDLLREPLFNWESRSELYNLLDVVIEVDFRDERKFAAAAAAKAKAGAEIVDLTYRSRYVENPEGQWQGYTDTDPARAWGVEEWARRAGQGAYFDWVTANALLPAVHPNETIEGIAKVDRTTNKDIPVISANLTRIQQVFDNANQGVNPVGVAGDTVPFDINPILYYAGYVIDDEGREGHTHFEQVYQRALVALKNAQSLFKAADEAKARLRALSGEEDSFLRSVFEQDLTYRNRLIEIFGTPYEGTIGSGKLYPPGYEGPDLITWMYADVREISAQTVPGPTVAFGGEMVYDQNLGRYSYNGGDEDSRYSFLYSVAGDGNGRFLYNNGVIQVRNDFRRRFAPTFVGSSISDFRSNFQANADVNYTGDANRRIDLQNFNLPIMARGYTFQAPADWGMRRSPGKLQTMVHQLLQQEAALATSIAAWDAFQGGLWRQIELFNAKFDLDITLRGINGAWLAASEAANAVILGFRIASAANEIIAEALDEVSEEASEATPKNLPTGGLAVSPGDSLAPIRAAIQITGSATAAGYKATKIVWDTAATIGEWARDLAKNILDFAKDNIERDYALQEALVQLENMIGDEAKLRIEIFKELESMRQLSDEFRAAIAEGQRLIDEREAYNKRVAVLAQSNRYQDMTFRVSRNAAIQNYRSAFNLAARYAYLAAKAYDYETSLPPNHAASALPVLSNIVGARHVGPTDDDGNPLPGSGLAGQLAILKTNFAALRNQLGINTPSNEKSRFSIRRELLRLTDDDEGLERWRQLLSDRTPGTGFYVDNLWSLPEFRRYCRPFAPLSDGPQPGLVISFPTSINPGQNVFGQVQAGGDHTFNVSDYATKIRSVGVWFEGYDNAELAQTPRVYLIPAGTDFQRMPYSDDFTPRSWNVIDARIPVPNPVTNDLASNGRWIPLVDSLSELMGEPRRYAMFRAYHSDPDVGTDAFDDSEVIWNSRLGGRSVWNNRWLLIIPGLTLHADPEEGLQTFIHGPVVNESTGQRDPSRAVRDIRILLDHFGFSGN